VPPLTRNVGTYRKQEEERSYFENYQQQIEGLQYNRTEEVHFPYSVLL
jgi:hypothetical protein